MKTGLKITKRASKKSVKKSVKKSWNEKLNDAKDLPRVIKLNSEAQKKWGGKTMVIPAPIEVDAIISEK